MWGSVCWSVKLGGKGEMLDDVVMGQKGDCRQRYNNMAVAGG